MDSKNHQQQQSWLVPWGIAGFAKPINMYVYKYYILSAFRAVLPFYRLPVLL